MSVRGTDVLTCFVSSGDTGVFAGFVSSRQVEVQASDMFCVKWRYRCCLLYTSDAADDC